MRERPKFWGLEKNRCFSGQNRLFLRNGWRCGDWHKSCIAGQVTLLTTVRIFLQ
jgi:hypothetical protein